MKCILLCGGFAKRLWPLTLEVSKPLLKAGGKPVLNYIVENVERLEEVDEILISTNARFKSDYESWKDANPSKKPVRIIIEHAQNEGEKLGAIGGINYVLQQEHINEDCLIIAGDNVISFDVRDFIAFYATRKKAVVAACDLKDAANAKLYGILKTDAGGRVIDFQEKPQHPASTLASTGCYVFPKSYLHYFAEYLREGNNKDAPGFFLQWLHTRADVYAFTFENGWFDIGDKDSLARAKKFMERQ